MLSLQLKSGEYLTIGEDIAVQVFEQSGSAFRVAVKAPREVPILRGEVHERTGERPDGLRDKRPKSPSDRRHSAKRFDTWVDQQARQKRDVDEAQDITRQLAAIADRLSDCGGDAVRAELADLMGRLDRLAERTLKDGKTAP